MAPTPSELHVDRFLTDISVEFTQDNWVHNQVFPVVPVQKQSDLYVVYDRGTFWRDQVKERPLGGQLDIATWDFDTRPYFCRERGLAHMLDDRQKANTDDPIQLEREAANLLTTQMMINNDRRWAEAYFKTGVWTTDRTGVAASPSATQFIRFDQSGSDPVGYIDLLREDMARSTAKAPNVMVVGSRVHRVLRNHADILDRIKYTNTATPSVTEGVLAAMFEVDKYVVARSVYNSAAEGLANDYDFILDEDSILLAYRPQAAGLNTPAAGYTFAWTGLLEGANAQGSAILRGREDTRFSDWFGIRSATDINIVSPDLGIFLHTAVTPA